MSSHPMQHIVRLKDHVDLDHNIQLFDRAHNGPNTRLLINGPQNLQMHTLVSEDHSYHFYLDAGDLISSLLQEILVPKFWNS